MKLVTLIDFVLQENKNGQQVNSITSQLHYELRSIKKYATFLRQPLKLEMFVPCDDEGNILEEPEDYELRLPNMMTEYNDEIYRYEQAQEKVLFYDVDYFYDEGRLTIKFGKRFVHFEDLKNGYIIEDLACWYNLDLRINIIERIFG